MAKMDSRPTFVVVSVPGSMMLSGEHAVLRGFPALVGAVRQRVVVRLQARDDDTVVLHSSLGTVEMPVSCICTDRPFQFAGAAIKAAAGPALACGFDLSIEAEMPPDVGLGSSAAVTVAVYAAVHAFTQGLVPAKPVLWQACRDVIRGVQGRGSGADAAASVYGGVLLYSQEVGLLEHFTRNLPDVCLFYAGYKTPTPEVIERVEVQRLQSPDRFDVLDARMGASTRAAAAALRVGDLPALGLALQDAQEVMTAYGVCDSLSASLLVQLLDQDGVRAAKISGSGLGDCVLVLGRVAEPEKIPFRQIPVVFDVDGMIVEWT